MLTKKQQLALSAQSFQHPRRLGVNKSQPGDLAPCIPSAEEVSEAQQDIMDDDFVEPTQIIDDEDEESDDGLDELAEAAFHEEAKFWMDQYASKMFEIAVAKWLTKKDKSAAFPSKTSPGSTLPPKKKQRTG